MPRLKTAIAYINQLCLNPNIQKRQLGLKLKAQYTAWVRTLNLQDFLTFNKTIEENKTQIGAAQFFGKFRAYSFEEYVFRLLQSKIQIPKTLQLFWGEKCLVWQKDEKRYAMEFDISIGKRKGLFVEPKVVFDTKIELDSARLKTALASFAIIKEWNKRAKGILVYAFKELDSAFLELATRWANGIFQFSLENDQRVLFLRRVEECLEENEEL
ncbi:MAG: hypothetical protein ACUVUF_06295 [Candidatus Bathycorpusculaceae bacterium]